MRETFFDSRNLPVAQLDYTGRAIPGVAVTETANRPTGQLRASDPQFFETRAQWNLNFLPTRESRCRAAMRWPASGRRISTPPRPRAKSGNLRTLRQIGLASETLVWRMQHEPGFGSVEHRSVSRNEREKEQYTGEGSSRR